MSSNKPWLKSIPYQQDLFAKNVCPICEQEKPHLVSILFQEGNSPICKECRQHETLADWYQPPKMQVFRKRVLR